MGFLTRALGRRITAAVDEFVATPEGAAAVRRSRHRAQLVDVVRGVAGSGLDDDGARDELQTWLAEGSQPVEDVIDQFGALRTSYLDDRAYRLLTAAVNGTPVRPIDPDVSEQFGAEARLGRMSLSDAFEHLVTLDPRLAGEPGRQAAARLTRGNGWSFGRSEPKLVGAWASSPHQLLNTDLAAAVVQEYSVVTRGGQIPDRDPTPFFDRKKRTRVGSAALFGKGDTRPRAQN